MVWTCDESKVNPGKDNLEGKDERLAWIRCVKSQRSVWPGESVSVMSPTD